MTHVIHIMEVISGYILPLTSSLKVINNDTCKWKLQIILFLYNYTYNMATNLACVWILYLKVISRIFMYRMYSAKNLKCLVRILENTFCNIFRAEVRIQNKKLRNGGGM